MTIVRPSLTLGLLLTACSLRAPPGGAGEATSADSSTGATTEDPDTGTPTSTGPTDPTTTTAATSTTADPGSTAEPCGFAGCETFGTTGTSSQLCDGLQQLEPECAPGQKCAPDFDAHETRCVDIVDEPKGLHEPCIAEGSGLDDCDLAMVCWDLDDDGHGTCHGLCDGPDATCVDPNAHCVLCQDCIVGLCLPGCDPLLHECDPGEVCIPGTTGDGDFLCALDASGDEGQTHDPCEFANACDDGLLCAPSDSAVECDPNFSGCCQPFCDLDLPNPCTGAGQICSPIFADGQAPAGLEELGFCKLP